jgi:transcriptional regulator with XRE-family HTH domain
VKEEEALKDLQERVGLKLMELRKKKGYTSHEDFAFDHDIPRVQYWRIEKGKTNLTLRSLIKLLSIHKMTVEEFFYGIHKETRKSP